MVSVRRLNSLYKLYEHRKVVEYLPHKFMSSITVSKEFSIPFPGGKIAAKSWGNEAGTPVLALHGWQDNLGTFERLIPLLPKNLYIVAFDFLGHGLSSHKPPGIFYDYMELLIEIQRVVNYLKWEHFNVIAHSMGGTVALLYGSLFPASIISMVCLDIIKPASRSPEELPEKTKDTLQERLKLEAKLSNPVPIYLIDEARERLMHGTVDKIMKEGADTLLQRGTRPSESKDGVVFTRDIRIQEMNCFQMFSHETLKAYLHGLKCPLLIIRGQDSVIALSRTPEVVHDFIDIYRANCESFELVLVKGGHFVHLDYPENVAPHINAFFKKYTQLNANL